VKPGQTIHRDSVRAVLFDAVGTLFGSRGTIGEIYSEVAAEFGVESDPVALEMRFQSLTARDGAPVDKPGWKTLVRNVFARSPRFDDFDSFFEDLYVRFRSASRWRLFPETASVLQALMLDGLALGLVTSFDHRVINVIEELGIARFFRVIHTADDSVFRKPDPRFFAEAAVKLGFSASEILVVGDDPVQDLVPARSAGMRALLIDRRRHAPRSPYLIRDLREVIPHVLRADR